MRFTHRFWRLGAVALVVSILGACGFGNPWPTVNTPPTTGHTVLMIGDSLLGQNDYSMVATLNHYGYNNITVIDAHINGTGLFGPVPYTAPDGTVTTYASALDWVKHSVAQNPAADTVVMEYGGACATCDIWAPWSVAYGSQAFYDAWTASAKGVIDWLKGQGKTVFWTESPQGGSDGSASGSEYKKAVAQTLSYLDATVYAPYAAKPVIDWWYALNDTTGAFQQILNYDNANHTVRYDDLIHITVDGSVRTSTWTISTLGKQWNPTGGAAPLGRRLGRTYHNNHLVERGDPVVKGPMETP